MPWVWRLVSSPAAGAKVVSVRGGFTPFQSTVFSLMGICISHNATAARRYHFRTVRPSTGETRGFFTIIVPPGNTIVLENESDTIISDIGAEGDERLEVIAIDGGEPTLSIGLKLWGIWDYETGYEMFG